MHSPTETALPRVVARPRDAVIPALLDDEDGLPSCPTPREWESGQLGHEALGRSGQLPRARLGRVGQPAGQVHKQSMGST